MFNSLFTKEEITDQLQMFFGREEASSIDFNQCLSLVEETNDENYTVKINGKLLLIDGEIGIVSEVE